MAAYAALLSLAQVIDDILSYDEHDYTFICTRDQLTQLKKKTNSFRGFLKLTFPAKYAKESSQLETRLTDVLYQLEDLIESNIKGSPCLIPAAGGGDDISAAFSGFTQEIDSLLLKARGLYAQREEERSAPDAGAPTSSSSIVEPGSSDAKLENNKDFKQIIDRALEGEKSLQIIPIVGMGGIGKTTLARAVYEDPKICSDFKLRFWVTVSQEYSVQEILKGILLQAQKQAADSLSGQNKPTEGNVQTDQNSGSSLSEKKGGKKREEPLDKQVHDKLQDRKFLIVLDDMWDAEAWQRIWSAIPKDKESSRVIVTTRLSGVAQKVNSSRQQHQMQFLAKEPAWDLLRGKVYGQQPCPPEFTNLGRRISENCDGLPLTIVVVAGLLKSNMTMGYWEQVERNINEAATRDDRLNAVLSLSYNNLPVHLKPCFLYMGAFPEDFRIPTRNLFRLWVAEGFIKPDPPKRLEEIAEVYLENLVERNLVLVAAKRCNGKIRSCSIHDVPRELSLKIAKEGKFLARFAGGNLKEVTLQNITNSQRHISVSAKMCGSSPGDDKACCNTFARSLLLVECPAKLQLTFLAPRLRLIKVLYGMGVTNESMLCQLFELTNLKLLHFHCCHSYIRVPNSICKLQKLETLIVTQGSVTIMPVDIWKIKTLRHIIVWERCVLEFPLISKGYPVLEHLQTLIMGEHTSSSGSAIRRMPNLKKFKLTYGYSSHRLNFGDLTQLENLRIRGSSTGSKFPPSLQKLTLMYTRISSWNDLSTIVKLLPLLQILKLREGSVNGDTWETEEDDFPKLKYLELSGLSLREWSVDIDHFPCLETLCISNMDCLGEISSEIGEMYALKKLIVSKCNNKMKESAESIQNQAKENGTALEVVSQ